jgi:XTP/dITP diphosphohydrolase
VRALLASGNAHKLDELQAALPGWEIALLRADGFPEEDGETYYQNARGKARYGRDVADPGAWILGEDSGIEAAVLGGRPGVESARWAEDGVAQLLAELDGAADRRARYVCELVALTPDGGELRGTGILEGAIASERRGDEGFGYDPIFIPIGEERTVAELGNAWKRLNSHRARAAAALLRSVSAMPQSDRSGGRDESDTGPGRSGQADDRFLVPAGEPPVDLGAEDDHVRHHVEPDEQQNRGSERANGDDLAREADEQR